MKDIPATGLILQVKSFFVLIFLTKYILSITKGLSGALQNTSLDLAKTTDLASGTIETLEDLLINSYWDHLFTYVESVAKLYIIQAGKEVICVIQSS